MGVKIDKQTYKKLIKENIDWLNKICPIESLEKDHIIAILKDSINLYYKKDI